MSSFQIFAFFLAASSIGFNEAAVADDLEARLASKRSILEARLAAAHELSRAPPEVPVEQAPEYETNVVDANGTDWGRFVYPSPNESESEHPADVAWAFAREKGLPRALRWQLQDDACNAMPAKCGRRRRAVVASIPVDLGNGPGQELTCELLDGRSAADAAFIFVQEQQLPQDSVGRLKDALCGRLATDDRNDHEEACRQDRALLFYRSAGPWPLGPWAVAATGASESVVNLPEAMEIWNGDEPADVLRAMLFEAHSRPKWQHQALTDHLCALPTLAKRRLARLQTQSTKNRTTTAAAEPRNSGSTDDSFEIEADAQAAAWPYLRCTRRRVIEQRQDVSDLGTLEVYEGEEVVDAIHRFAFVHHIHDPSAKKQLLHHMCSNRPDHTAPCTRDMALLLKATVHTGLDPDLFKDEDGKGKEGEVDDGMNENWFVFDEGPAVPSPLVVWENEEPADVIHNWCEAHHLSDAFRDALTRAVCRGGFSHGGSHGGRNDALPSLKCSREQAVVLSMPLADENGRPLGLFTLLAHEEPADAARAFSQRNRVGPHFRQALLGTLCGERFNLTCSRTRAYAVKRPVSAHAGYTGPRHRDDPACYKDELEVWEDDEPADAVYRMSKLVPGGMPMQHRQGLVFWLCSDPDLGLVCNRILPALFSLSVTDEKGDVQGPPLDVLEGMRPADALLDFMKGPGGTSTFKLAQVFKHPNLRPRLFQRLCAAAAAASTPLDCSVDIPRLKAVNVELTYSGIKTGFDYFFPDQHFDPLFPEYADTQCVPLAAFGLEPLSNYEEQQVARYGYDQSMVDAESRTWLVAPSQSALEHRGGDSFNNNTTSASAEESQRRGPPILTEAESGCLGPTRRAVVFFCLRLAPVPNNCVRDIHGALIGHLIRDDSSRWTKAGPVGIDYYQMMRCPNDAPLAEVKRRMAMVGAEVQSLNANVSRTVAIAADASRQGTAGFTEASAGLVGARASSKGARALLLAAAKSLAGARLSLEAATEHRKAAAQSLSAAVGVAEALRQRLVVACNATAHARNCSSTLQWVPLDSLGPPTEPAHVAALRLEKELAWAYADDIANATANGTLSSGDSSSSSASGHSYEARPPVKSTLDMDELRRRREELARGKSTSAAAAETSTEAHAGASNENDDSSLELSPVEVEEAAYAAEAARAKWRADALEAAVSKGPSRLVPHEIWTLCLEQPFITKRKSAAYSSPSSEAGNDESAAVVVTPQQIVVQSEVDAAAAHAVAYQAAAEGCARWQRNETWVCPVAQERLSSWLPRFPVEPALTAAMAALAAGRSALNAAKEGLGSSKRSSGAAQQLLTAAKSGRALSNAALRSAKQQLLVGNSSVNWLRSEGEDAAGRNMEAAKHRSWAMERAAFDLTEGKNREFYDKPCKPVFGACCARDQADGGMNIICG